MEASKQFDGEVDRLLRRLMLVLSSEGIAGLWWIMEI